MTSGGVPILGRSLFGRSLVHGYKTHGREKLPPSGRKTKAQDKGERRLFPILPPGGRPLFPAGCFIHPASPTPDRCNLGTPDKRFEAKAKTDDQGEGSHVLLTRASDGTTLEPIMSVDQYRAHLIEEDDSGPTVCAAWEKWGE